MNKDKMEKSYCTAIVLAAGSGKRMGTTTHKQYLLMGGHPVLFYSLRTFQESEFIDEIILVTGKDEQEYCRKEIVDQYGFTKVSRIVEGGAERFNSVWNGLQLIKRKGNVYIHDGARPFIDEGIIERAYECGCKSDACIAGMPVKDTIKIADTDGFIKETPKRSLVWQRVESTPDRATLWAIQTPQVFLADLLLKAYGKLMKQNWIQVTDDAMVVEKMLNHEVQVFTGKYENIKITTPEDLVIAEAFLDK